MMVAVAGAQTADTQAAMAAQAQAERIEAQVQRQADERARMAERSAVDAQTQAERIEAQMEPLQAKIQAQMKQMEPLQAKIEAQLAPLQARMQVAMLPMEARLEVGMAPMEAEMMARSAAMMARGAMLQGGMVSVGDPQVKDDLFAGTEKFAKGASDVTSVNLGPDMLGMVSGKHGGDVAHKMNFMVVRTYEYPHAGMYNPADLEVYRQRLRDGKWNCFIHTYESKTGESTDICNRPLPGGQGNEMVIMTVEPKELTFIHMSGKGSLADLGKLGSLGRMGGMVPEMPEQPEQPERPEKPQRPEPQ